MEWFSALFWVFTFSCVYAAPNREPEKHSVVIVGAGVSGISAAATLLEAGIDDVILLEASDRIGGRIHTVEFGGIQIDKGAEFVHGEVDNAVYELVGEHKDRLLFSYEKTYFKSFDQFLFTNPAGDDFNSSVVQDLLNQAYDVLDTQADFKDNETVDEYYNSKLNTIFKEQNVDPKLGEAVRHTAQLNICSYIACDDLSQIGKSTFTNYQENPGDLTWKWKTTGYKIIFDFLTKKFPNPANELPVLNKTIYGKQAETIKLLENGSVSVKCTDGSTYLADHVIVTVSLGVLKKHAADMFQPALSPEKTAAIKALGFGSVGTVFVLFPERWWPEGVANVIPIFSGQELKTFKTNTTHGRWTGDSIGFYPVLNNDRMLCVWYSGEACRTMESLTEEQVVDGVTELLKNTFGHKFVVPRPESILRSTWASNPFTLGSYSFRSAGSDRQNVSHADIAVPILHNNKPVILFAGEATHPYYYSTVHGALASGRREANSVIKYLKNKQ